MSTEASTTETTTTATTTEVATPAAEPKTLLGEENAETQPNAEGAPAVATATQKPEGEVKPAEAKPTKTLLDDEEEAKPSAEPKPGEGEQPAAPSADDVEKFCSGIKATDLGDGVTWSDDTLKAMAPSLMELTGNDPAKADGVVKAYSGFVQEQARKQQEAAEAFNDGLIKECQARFGADLKKVAKFAREGGRAIFGDQLWAALKSTPAFANNPDVLERLAEHGRRIAEDNGTVKPTGGAPAPADEDVLHRMYGNVKVG